MIIAEERKKNDKNLNEKNRMSGRKKARKKMINFCEIRVIIMAGQIEMIMVAEKRNGREKNLAKVKQMLEMGKVRG